MKHNRNQRESLRVIRVALLLYIVEQEFDHSRKAFRIEVFFVQMDTRYLISNCKDQTIKLWDMRRFANDTTIKKSRAASSAVNRVWDYRMGAQPQACRRSFFLLLSKYILIIFQFKDMKYPVIQVCVHIADTLLVIHLSVAIFRHHLLQDNDISLLDHPMLVYIVSHFRVP